MASGHWRKRTLHLCFGYEPGMTPLNPLPATTAECEPHTPVPSGYLAWSGWADEMTETHNARPCKGCGLWLIWEPKEKADA